MRFLNDLAILETNIKGLSVVLDTQYETKDITRAIEAPFFRKISL